MNKKIKTSIVFLFVITTVFALLVYHAWIGYTLANVDNESRSKVIYSKSDQIYLKIPREFRDERLSNLSFNLETEERSIPVSLLSSWPPYEPIGNSRKKFEEIILSIYPNQFSSGSYHLEISTEKNFKKIYQIKLKNEFYGPWSY